MSHDISTPPEPKAEPNLYIELSIWDVQPEGDHSPYIDFTMRAVSVPHILPGGYVLWSESADGTFRRHMETKNGGRVTAFPWGTRAWHTTRGFTRDSRFFAAREYENPVRASNYVVLDALPQAQEPTPTEVVVRDGGLSLVVTGRRRGAGEVRCTVAEKTTTVTSRSNGQFQAVIPAPPGRQSVRVVAVGDHILDSDPLTASANVSEPVPVPLMVQYPEEGRKITRLDRVTGSGTPGSTLEIILADGPPVIVSIDKGIGWEAKEVVAAKHGPAVLQVTNVSTGQVIQRDVEVAYFPQWDIMRLVFVRDVDPDTGKPRIGAVAEGTGEAGDIVEINQPPAATWTELAVVEGETWRYEQYSPPPPFKFRPGRVMLRTAGDPVPRMDSAETAAPLVTSPLDGEAVGTMPTLEGKAWGTVIITMADGTRVTVPTNDAEGNWSKQLGPLPLGRHTFTLTSSPSAIKEITYLTVVVIEDEPEAD